MKKYEADYIAAADTTGVHRADLDKPSLEANKFLRTIKQVLDTDSRLKSVCDDLISYINEGIYAKLPRILRALAREYKNDREKIKRDEYKLQAELNNVLNEYRTTNQAQVRETQDISNPQIIISETFI